MNMTLTHPWTMIVYGCSVVFFFILLYLAWTQTIVTKARKSCGHYVYFMPRLPFIGNALLLINLKNSAAVWNFVTECGIRYKKGVMFWLFHVPWIIVTELDVIEAILSSSESIEKSHVYRLLDTITDGVFTVNGLRWKKLRKKLNLTFSQKQLDMIYDDVNEQTAICIEILKKNSGKHINIMTFLTTYFFDIVTRTHFGAKTNEQTQRTMCTTEKAARIIEMTLEHRVFKLHNHINLFFKLTRALPFIRVFRAEPLVFIREMITKRLEVAEIEKAQGTTDERKRICYVDGVKEALEELDIEPTAYNIERNSADMLIAASDTTSVAVSSVFYHLSLHQDIQEKVYQEVLAIFGNHSTIDFTREDFNRMEYLEMVIKETLRHTAPPGLIRELTKELNVGKYTIPKSANVYLALRPIHMSPEYYERPEEYYPEHFTADRIKQRPKYAFLPFSQGPRNCPGMAYSYVTMKAIISSVVRNFKLETNVPLKDIEYKMILMQEHKHGYFIKLTPRM